MSSTGSWSVSSSNWPTARPSLVASSAIPAGTSIASCKLDADDSASLSRFFEAGVESAFHLPDKEELEGKKGKDDRKRRRRNRDARNDDVLRLVEELGDAHEAWQLDEAAPQLSRTLQHQRQLRRRLAGGKMPEGGVCCSAECLAADIMSIFRRMRESSGPRCAAPAPVRRTSWGCLSLHGQPTEFQEEKRN